MGGEGWQKKYMKYTRKYKNIRSSWEQQRIVAFCTCQWNEWMNEWMNEWTVNNVEST
jgi:hypothetical protein